MTQRHPYVWLGLLALLAGTLPPRPVMAQRAPLPARQSMDSRLAALHSHYVTDEVLVGVREERFTRNSLTHLQNTVGIVQGYESRLHAMRVKLHPGVSVAQALSHLQQQGEIAYAEPNYVRHTTATPTDTYYATQQYGPQKIHADTAWNYWSPKRNVILAIVDTGVANTHEDLTNKMLRDGSNHIIGYNATTSPPAAGNADDDYGHGTHVAGIAAAEINNGKGIAGIAGWDGVSSSDPTSPTYATYLSTRAAVKIMPVKVLDSTGSGTDSQVADGVMWAADHGANVINLSLGSTGFSTTLDNAMQYAFNKGVVVVAAAGNDGSSEGFYPADCGNVVSVAATDSSDALTSFSNYGSQVSVAAPGLSIYSTLMNGSYGNLSGTSMASPHVAGEAALLMAQSSTITNDQVINLIKNNIETYSGSAIFPNSGRVHVANALTAVATLSDTTGTATFVKTDTSTQGSWIGSYGSDGYVTFGDTTTVPSYVQFHGSGNVPYTWASSTTDTRALQTANGSSRLASCWYNAGETVYDMNFTDGLTHQVALYMVDWDSTIRTQKVEILDETANTVLDTQNVSGFNSGKYLIWKLSGHVKVRITNTNTSLNEVTGGVFFDPQNGYPVTSTSATYVKTDTSTSGSWQGVYGGDGYNILGNASSYPSYASVSSSGNSAWTWNASTTDTRALQKAGTATDRIAACWYSGSYVAGSSFTVDVNLTDGLTHQVSWYMLDWDSTARSQKVEVLDAATSTVLDTQNVSSFHNGAYLVYNIKGHVKLRFTNSVNTSCNAVLSGLFFDPAGGIVTTPTSATYVKTDTSTSGSWKGVYGSAGYNILGNTSSYPSYASVSSSGNSAWTWNASTTDTRALQKAGTATDRIAACWYSGSYVAGSSFTVDVNLTDGLTHQVSWYMLDWDSTARSQKVEVLDAATSTVLDTQNVSSFHNGAYLVYNIKGHVKLRFTNSVNTSCNAVLSGLFFD